MISSTTLSLFLIRNFKPYEWPHSYRPEDAMYLQASVPKSRRKRDYTVRDRFSLRIYCRSDGNPWHFEQPLSDKFVRKALAGRRTFTLDDLNKVLMLQAKVVGLCLDQEDLQFEIEVEQSSSEDGEFGLSELGKVEVSLRVKVLDAISSASDEKLDGSIRLSLKTIFPREVLAEALES